MKKQLIWALTLVLLALFPYQSVRADYCSPAGNMTNTHTTGTTLNRKLTSFTLSDGTNSVSLDNIQTSYTDAIYKDRTSEVLTTAAGATLNFSAMSDVSWMHGYVYIDYDRNETFSNTANNNGTTGGELVSYNYYNGKNINNATMTEGCGVSASNIPSWTLPSNLAPGEYRLRFKIDWNSLDPCGSSDMASNNGCVVDITIKVVPSYPKMTYFYSNNIQQANRYLKEVVATQGGNTTTVFSASSESDLPRIDPMGANTVLNEAQGALVDKTQNPIIIDQGATEFTINFKGWTNNMTIGGTSKSSELNWTQQAVFIDWNNDLDFLDSGENYGKSGDEMPNEAFISAAGYTRTISIPQGVQPGTYRMRVCYYEPTDNSDNWHEKLFTEYGAKTRNGKSYDFVIQVVSSTYTINVASTAGGSAEITAGGSGTSATVNSGSSVTLTATPNSGFIFVNWTNSAGTVVSTDATYTFNATKTDTYTAKFVKECTVSVTIPDATQGTITINGEEATASHTITEGTSVELQATPKAGYKFEKWVINGSEQTANPYTTTVTSDMTVSAVFAQLKQFTFNVTQPTGGTISVVNGEGQSVTTAYENENITVSISVNGAYTLNGLYINDNLQALDTNNSISFTLTDVINSEINIRAELTKIPVEQLYAAMSKPTFTQAGNLKAVDTYAEILEGSIGAIAGAVDMSTLTTVKTGDHTWKQGATAPIYLSPGAQFRLKTNVHATTFYGMQLYLLHNTADEILETYGYYGKTDAWDTDEFWAEVNADTKISADQTASTITFPITLPESVKVGDIVVLRAISTATVTSPTVSAGEGVYVDYLFHVVEPTVITNVAPENSGTVTMSPADVADIKIGTQVTLTATPAEGYTIVNWTDANGAEVAGANTTYIFNASKDNVYTVNFGREHTITIASANSDWGSVNFSGEDPSVNSKTVVSGSSVTVVATPAAGYAFVNWTDDNEVSTNASYTFEVTDDLSLTANFVAKTECTVTVTPVEGGNVTYTVGGVAVDKIYEGDEVTFTATTQGGYEFVRWVDGSGNPLSTANPYTVTVNADMTIAPVYESVPIEIDLFNTSNGSLSIPPYRIPGIAKTSTGRLIAVAARLVCGTDPGYGQVDVVCRTSDNNGVNWSDIKDVAVGDGRTSATQNYFETAYGDPAIVADRTSNEVAIFVVAGCTVYANANTTRQNPNMIGVIRSTDNGSTWGAPENITEQIYSLFDNGNPIQSAFIAGGKVFQSRIVKVGNYYRLYAAMCARPNGNRVIYSDDFGRTWLPLGGEFALPVPNGDEPKCEELPDGRVIVSSRVGGGRYYNIFTYTNTASATGSWQSQTLATLAQGSNATNGEILIVPVVRNSDSKEMYLALQSLPAATDGTRKKVTIFYKELTSFDDYNTVTNFASGWDGSYLVTDGTSAYSSMDLQADNKIAFIYEKNYTSFGRVANPVSTCFPNGEGDHGYDGYDNTYVSYNLEYITNGAYTVKPNVNRGEIVKGYLTTLVEQSTETADVKAELKTKIAEFGDNPTTAQVDAIYSVLYADPWDGKVVTFTNVQSNGDKRALYINGSNVLSLGTTSQTAESLGASAQFLCIKQANGKYTFKNIATNNYMIWIGSSDGYNNNTGTLSTYNATYCDWSINDANSTKAGTYCLVSKRGDGTTNGSLIVAQSNGAFDLWTDTPICGQHTNGNYYSNVYEIGIVSGAATEELIVSAKEIISNTGVGYPKQGSSARTTLQNAIVAAEANPTAAAGITLQNAINTYYTATDIELPANGVLYSFIVGHNENKAYIYNNSGTLALAKYTENMQLPETAKFTCEVNGNYFDFRTSDGKYIAFPNYGVENYTDASPDGIEDNISDLTKFSTTKLLGNGDKVTVSNEDLFGKIYLTVLLRGTVKEGDHVGEKQSGVYVVKFKNNGSVLNPPVWDGASDPYGNDNFSSAISVVAMGYPLTATAEPAGGGTATVSPTSVSAGGSATFTASAANAGYVFDGWYNGNEKLTGELVYNATNITTSLNLTAKYIQQGVVSVTVPSEFGKVMKGEDVVEGSISGNVGEIVQLTAVADEGYIFDRWVVKNTSTNQIRLKSTSTIDVELGTYKVEAYFAPKAYEQICKPTFVKSGNVFTVQSASISDGVGVENGDIVGTAFNMKNADEVQPDLGEPAQWGATKAILVEPGATFTLNVEYMKNWADVELFINEGDVFTTIYGPYEGSDAAGSAFENMDNISTSGNIASFPITISNDLEGGDIVVIRSASGEFGGNACKESLDQGGYLDFVFVVKNLPKRTVSVQVTPIDAAESVTINGFEQTTLTASGDITINVEPKDGYRFVKWTDVLGNDVSTDKEYVDNSTQDTTYVANLVKLWKVTVTTNNGTWGIADISGVDANGFVDNAADVTLTATSNNNARFMYWGLKTTENEEEVIKPVTTTNPFKTTILRNEDYVAVFEGDYPTMRLKYENNGSGTDDDERRVNRYLASVTATAGDLTTEVFEATNESGLPRIDAEVSAFYKHNEENLIPTTSGALIDKTGNAIMVKKGTETITLNFKSWLTNISLRANTAEPELDETQQAIFVDWNNDKDFSDNGENLGIVSSSAEKSFVAADGYNREISIPASAECGTYRMRVIYYDNLGSSDDWTSTIFNDCVINRGRAYDFEIDIVDDTNYITFNAPGERYFNIGDKANIQVTYPDNNAVIYYTTDGFDPDENSPSITNGDSVAINTLQEGMITLKAIAMVDGVKSQVYKAVYTVVSKSSNLGTPTIKSAADATTIVAAEISLGVGIANGPIDYNFTKGQQVKLNAIPTTATATFSLDVTLDLNKYGLLIYRLDALKNTTQKSIKLAASYTADEIVSLSSFKNTLESKGFLYDTIPGAEDKIKIKIPIAMGEFADLSNGESVIYRLIVTNIETENNVTLLPDQDYGIGEYVDFVFTVSPQTTKTKVAGGAGKQLSFTITTDNACYLSVGGNARNLDEAGTTTIQAPLNVVGEMEIQSVGANISNMDIEILEYGTNVVLPNVDYLGTVTVKSDADLNATTISYASQLPAEGIKLVVEKEIYVPYEIEGKTPTYFNFLSLPFDIDCGLNIEYWDGDSWETAVMEKDIRILKYNSRTRSQGKDYYDYTWNTIGGTGGMIYANEGFVLVGNSEYGDADHKMKIRFKSFYPTDNTNVKRELKYFQDGGIKTVGVLPYRNTQGETHVCDADWNHIGSPYLTYTDAIDYVVYYHNGYSYQSVSPSENRQLRPFESFMFQANMEQLNQKDIAFFPLSANNQNSALNVYGRAYLAINGEESVKVILNDEASENFVVNEDGWYMAPTTNVFSTMSLKVAGSEASMSVQPEPNELPLTVYVGANAQQTISLSRFDGENNIFLKDAITEEVVCLNDEDYTFTATPYSTISDRFTITMIEPTGIGDQAKADANIKAVVTTEGIKLFGTVEGDEVTLYSANGMVIANAVAEDGVTTIPTSAEGVIIIKVADETVKVVR